MVVVKEHQSAHVLLVYSRVRVLNSWMKVLKKQLEMV